MTALEGRAVLVTGATGFIGSRLAERLAEGGASVTGLGRSLERVPHLREAGVELMALDLVEDRARLAEAVEGRDVVFHAAAAMGTDPGTAEKVNVEGTDALARAAGEAGVRRLVHVSTVGAYDMAGREVVDEGTPLAVDHAATYPRTKARSEVRAFAAADASNLEVAVVRPSMVYGPGHGVWTVQMARNVCQGKPVWLGDGSAWFNPVYLDDVVDALLRCATVPAAAGEAFNVSAEVTTWRDFMGHYSEPCGREPTGMPLWLARLMAAANRIPGVATPVDSGFIEMATARKRFPVEKARRLLDWIPRTPLERGMAQTVEWLRDSGALEGARKEA